MKKAASQLLAGESADWHHRGLIGAALAEQLGQRYERQDLVWAHLTGWLGFAAIFLLTLAVLTAIGLFSQSAGLTGTLLGVVAAGFWFAGIRLATDPAQRHAVTGSALVTVGLAAAYGAMLLLASALNDGRDGPDLVFGMLLVTSALGLAIAYRHSLRWPLLLSLICLFHGLGAWHQYVGHGGYVADIQSPPAMAVIAGLATLFGLWHQQAEDDRLARYVGFGRLYVIFGLIYLNCSLWFMTIGWDRYNDDSLLGWILAFTAVCLAQIVAGARLKDSKLTGFGIVFLGIDLYTRFFEHFWDQLSLGLFLAIAGLLGIIAGWLFERRALS
jgi:MFS family permease